MDSIHNNPTFHGNKPSLNKAGSKANFSHAPVAKSDVGDFQEGYFVMAEMPQQHRPKTHKTPERNNQRKNEHNHRQQSRERSTKDLEQLVRESDIHVSHGRLPTSPTRSPPRNSKRNQHTSPQHVPHQTTYMDQPNQPLSPHKPRKAHHEKRSDFSLEHLSGSPPKDKGPSPPPSRWAGPAFTNAPPPSSLPMPEFPPFQSISSPTLTSLSSSPPSSGFAPIYPEPQQFFAQPPLYAPIAYPAAYSVQFSYADVPQPQNLAQLSTDLRRMLNISQPISA